MKTLDATSSLVAVLALSVVTFLGGCGNSSAPLINMGALKQVAAIETQPTSDVGSPMTFLRNFRKSGAVSEPVAPQQPQQIAAPNYGQQANYAQPNFVQPNYGQPNYAPRVPQNPIQSQVASLYPNYQVPQTNPYAAQASYQQQPVAASLTPPQLASAPSVPTANLQPARPTPGTNVAHLGDVLTTPQGQTLYKHLKDGLNNASCSDVCALSFAPYIPTQGAAPGKRYSFFMRADGINQWAFEGQPLYVFRGDLAPGQKNGDGKFNMVAVSFAETGQQSAAASVEPSISVTTSKPPRKSLLKRLNIFNK